jgi:endo-1,3-1,4-beta-glycanase ExoK
VQYVKYITMLLTMLLILFMCVIPVTAISVSTPSTLNLGNSTTNIPSSWCGSAYYVGNVFHYNGVTFTSDNSTPLGYTNDYTSAIVTNTTGSNSTYVSNSATSNQTSTNSNVGSFTTNTSSSGSDSGNTLITQAYADNTYPSNGVINWKGQRWYLANGGKSLPGNNYWDNTGNGVWIDSQGRLHLSIRKNGDVWKSTMLNSQYKYKYGTFTWKVDSPVYTYDKNSVVGLFTYFDDNNELDIETSRWGSESNGNLWYTVQPYNVAGNEQGYNVPSYIGGKSTYYRIDWQPTYIRFVSWKTDGTLIADYNYTNVANIPTTAQYAMMNFWMLSGTTPQNDMELIISDFSASNTGEIINGVKY